MKYLTASKLYDYLQCPHKVWRDIYGPQNEKDPPNPFVQLLWEKGVAHEKQLVSGLKGIVDLSHGDIDTRLRLTLKALKSNTPLIYQGVIEFEDLRGTPDLLELQSDGTYLPIDIKSGRGYEETPEDFDSETVEKYKPHYAVQLALYDEILHNLGFSHSKKGIIWDIDTNKIVYDLSQPKGVRDKRSWSDFYQHLKTEVRSLMSNQTQNIPSYAGACKLCPWYHSCKKWCEAKDDPTLIFYVGRSKRDVLLSDLGIQSVPEILSLDLPSILEQKKKQKGFLNGIGESTLDKIIKRARVLKEIRQPVFYSPITFPQKSYELFFDIEDDPTRAFVYLHGVYERGPKGERFVPFVAKDFSEESEKQAWIEFWEYIRSLPKDDFAVYYYSKHEFTTYKKLQHKYSDVITLEEVEQFFNPSQAVDLYEVIFKYSDWPVSSYSLKEIAKYLKFSWRDKTPSGALSIEWYSKYLETKDHAHLQRILDYNEDDCKATLVIKDGIEKLQQSVSKPAVSNAI